MTRVEPRSPRRAFAVCVFVLAAAGSLTVLLAAPASATVVDQGRFVDEPYGFSYDCGFPVEVSGVATGNFRLWEGQGDDSGAFFSLDRMSFARSTLTR